MQTVTKEAQAQGKTAPVEEELAIVNQRNGTSLTAEEVYLFTVRLCDNQTDRDQEYFSRKDLERLRQETVRLGLLAEEGLGGETLRAIADRLEEPELERLRACYARRLEEKLPMPVQLRYDGGETGPEANDGSFVI